MDGKKVVLRFRPFNTKETPRKQPTQPSTFKCHSSSIKIWRR